MGPSVFINFRGKDQAGYAALLDRELSAEFGAGAVFHSSRSIEPGQDFVEILLARLAGSSVLLAVIGPDWTSYLRSSADSHDWVRREIAVALSHGISVIPILVEDAAMPPESQLPADLAALPRCQYLRLHHRNIEYDLARIVAVVAQHLQMPTAHGVNGEAPRGSLPLYRTLESPCRVGALAGSIRHVRSVDIWVNSENTDMEMSRFNEFTMSGIIRYWGACRDDAGAVVDDLIARELAERVGQRRPVAPGTVVVTGPGALADTHRVRHIIHVAAVQGEPGSGYRQIRDVSSAVTAVLVEADRLAAADTMVRSIVLPLFGVGTGGGSLTSTARAMVRTIVDHLHFRPATLLETIYVLGYRKSELAVVSDCLIVEPRLAVC